MTLPFYCGVVIYLAIASSAFIFAVSVRNESPLDVNEDDFVTAGFYSLFWPVVLVGVFLAAIIGLPIFLLHRLFIRAGYWLLGIKK